MPRYVVLNLADPGQMGPVTKVKSGIEAKIKAKGKVVSIGDEVVPIHDLFDHLGKIKDGQALGSELDAIKADCDGAEKIFLCTHGTASDTENAFAQASGGTPLGSWKDLGRLMRKLLPRKDKTYKIALVMCYGARTEQYHARDLDHQGMIPASMLKTSFAYKFYKYLCEGHGRSLVMTARTGAVSFDQNTGKSSVEQEAAIDIALEMEEYLRSPKIQQVMNKWKEFKASINSSAKAKEWVAVDMKYRDDPSAFANPLSSLQRAGKAYHQAVAKKIEMETRQWTYADLQKYGKLVYSHSGGKITIVNKYGDGKGIGPATLLYEGPFL
jgi:hypothetical protein